MTHSHLPARKLYSLIATLAVLLTPFMAQAIARPAATADICTGRAQAGLDDRIRACSFLIGAKGGDNERLAILHTSRGAAWRAKGDLDRALADHEEAIRLQPASALLYFNRAVTWLSKNDTDRAIADFGQAIQLAPDFGLAYRGRGDLIYGKGNFTGAISEYDAVVRLNAKDSRALAMRGLAKWQLGDRDGGKTDIAAAMRIDIATTVALVSQARPVATAAAAKASTVSPTIWDFKGSRVALETDDADRRFYYETPRAELLISGVAAGTHLFEGRQDGHHYAGKAFVFSRKCGSRSYDVSGTLDDSLPKVTLTLSGKRPQIDANCRPTGQLKDDVLTFSYPVR